MRGYSIIGLFSPKRDPNIGGACRAAYCYESKAVLVQGKFTEDCADTPKFYRHHPVLEVESLLAAIPHECIPVCVELLPDAVSLIGFHHPERAFYIFGPENGSVPREISDKCALKIYIPTKGCMNLAATVNVVLYDRMVKSQAHQNP